MKLKTSVAVIGQGFVGGSLTTVLVERGNEVYTFDIAKLKKDNGGIPFIDEDHTATDKSGLRLKHSTLSDVQHYFDDINSTPLYRFVSMCEKRDNFSHIYFVCLPTPMLPDGTADISIVQTVLDELSSITINSVKRNKIVVLKSTVPPGSVDMWNRRYKKSGLQVVFNPEFLREASALDDMRNQKVIILGGPRPQINVVKRYYERIFQDVNIIKTTSTTAEMVKYVINVHLAVKVSLANEFYQICNALDSNNLDIDYDQVMEYSKLDSRLGNSHWSVPGPMPIDNGTFDLAFGFGGSCFVKDINALIQISKKLGVKPTVMEAAWQKNLEVRPQRDWEFLEGRAISKKVK